MTTTEENKAIARRVQEEFWGQRNHAVADELLGPTHVDHKSETTPDVPPGPEGYKQVASHHLNAFPDLRITIEMQIAEGDYVVTRWKAVGTNTGSYHGRSATNKSVTLTGITIDHIVDGKLVESWTEYDHLDRLRQLGIAPVSV